jgi:hypothetical protein
MFGKISQNFNIETTLHILRFHILRVNQPWLENIFLNCICIEHGQTFCLIITPGTIDCDSCLHIIYIIWVFISNLEIIKLYANTLPFYTRNWSVYGVWYLWRSLKLILCKYQGVMVWMWNVPHRLTCWMRGP